MSVTLFKASDDDSEAYTLYAKTDDGLYCEIHHPADGKFHAHEVSDEYPIERIKGQFDAEQVEPSDIDGLWAYKAQILDFLESHDGKVTMEAVDDAIDTDPNTVYGCLKHLKWDGLLEATSGNTHWWLA
jgi:hypothetical protein